MFIHINYFDISPSKGVSKAPIKGFVTKEENLTFYIDYKFLINYEIRSIGLIKEF